MPTRRADAEDAERVAELFHAEGATHVRTRTYGAAVIIESGPKRDPARHARLRRDTVHLWCLDIADHRGKWERTPFRATLDELVASLMREFPWVLAPLDDKAERTSDPEH
jgi:hypothetical protein